MIGVYFQFYAIREMEKISVGNALARAFKADFFSLLSWQVGMYGWMAIVYFVLFINEPLPNAVGYAFRLLLCISYECSSYKIRYKERYVK